MLIFVLNLESRRDRRSKMEAQLDRCGLSACFTSDWEGPYDWRSLGSEELAQLHLFPWEIQSENPWWSRSLKLGEIACSLAHDACWRRLLDSSEDMALVLEDDAVVPVDLESQMVDLLGSLPSGWGLCYLGRFPIDPDEPFSEKLVRPGYSHCTFAYMISREGASALVDTDIRSGVMPVDEFIPAHYVTHPRPDVAAHVCSRLEAFAVEPPLVHQEPKEQAGSDTEDSPFV